VVIEVVILFERPRCQAVRGTQSGGSGTVCTMDIRELTAREEVGELTQAHLMRQGQARRRA
jgi:hypothetical protein